MKVAFIHDHPFRVMDNERVYSPGQFPRESWDRYLDVFDSLVVMGREQPIDSAESTGDLNPSWREEVEFVLVKNFKNPVTFMRRRGRIRDRVREVLEQIDGVVARTSTLGIMAAEMAKEREIPYAIEVVGCPWDAYWNYGNLSGKIWAPIAALRQRRAIANADFALYVSNRFLQERYPTDGVTCSASNVEIDPQPEEVRRRRIKKIQNRKTPLVFGLVGSLDHEYKGFEVAFRAIDAIRDKLPDFEIRHIGPGDREIWQSLLKKLELSDHVEFQGVLPGGKPVLEWLDSLDIYLHPSFQEGLPRIVIEAMGRATPVLGSTTGGIPELISAEWLHDPGDHKQLASQIDEMWHEPELLELEARRNFLEAQRYYFPRLKAKRHKFYTSFAESIQQRHVRTGESREPIAQPGE